MPTPLVPFANSEIRMRYKEPFLTEGLNAKLAVNQAPGVYRGFRLGTHANSLTVTVVPDPVGNDHSVVYQTATGRSLTLRKEGGSFSLVLSAYASKTIVIAIYATYILGSESEAEIRAYEFFPTDEFTGAAENAELVVIGTVVVPAAGVIPAANIVHDRRRMAWENEAVEAVPWSPIIKNPSFEHGVTGASSHLAISDWVNGLEGASLANGYFRLGTTTVRSGAKSLEVFRVGAGPINWFVRQYQEIPVVPGQLVRVVGWVRQLQLPVGSLTFNLYWGDLDSVASGSSVITASLASGVDATFRKVEAVLAVPAGSYVLKTVGVEVAGYTVAAPGVGHVIDDFQVYVEAGTNLAIAGAANARLKEQLVSNLIVEDPISYTINQLAARLRFDRTTPSTEGRLLLERKAGSGLPPILELGRMLLGNNFLSSAVDARRPRVSVRHSGTYDATLVWESLKDSGGIAVRLYVNLSGHLMLTVNASYDGINWNKDSAGSRAHLVQLVRDGFEIYTRDADAAWTTWTLYFKTTGPRTTTAAVPTFAPILAVGDSVGNRRVIVDHLGLVQTRQTVIYQNWLAPFLAAWSAAVSGTATATTILSNTAIQGPARRLFVPASSDQANANQGNVIQANNTSNQIHVVEWEMDTDTVGFGPVTFEGGFRHDETAIPSSEDAVKVHSSSSAANYQFITTGTVAGTGSSDTGVPVGGFHRFRIEWYGSATPGGARAICYIDGVLRAERTTFLPDSAGLTMAVAFSLRNIISVAKYVVLSPVRYTGTRYLSEDAL